MGTRVDTMARETRYVAWMADKAFPDGTHIRGTRGPDGSISYLVWTDRGEELGPEVRSSCAWAVFLNHYANGYLLDCPCSYWDADHEGFAILVCDWSTFRRETEGMGWSEGLSQYLDAEGNVTPLLAEHLTREIESCTLAWWLEDGNQA